ncbi:uncharacterized protein LOC127103466 [Lathyrus oleraceus]|uniref:uncharacterized protein LOC127103466 n=1 Tax=Pisum sativum TaxID=3888 RepID=UPI0021D0BB5D|nr:uncharacterized protein LOC127103466 [Pisum sativum]
MTSEAFKLKGLSEQVRNDFIREVGERLHARLAREAEEKSRREAEEKARQKEEQRVREAAEKAVVEAAAATVEVAAAVAEAEVKADAEEAAHIAAKEVAKPRKIVLTQGEKSHSDFAPLVLKTLEELQKEQQIGKNKNNSDEIISKPLAALCTVKISYENSKLCRKISKV